ncbi:hypothetical protein R0J91_20170, partial [Micrococcus sp. SIMBA_131]
DLALKFDPEYKEIAQRFQKDPSQFEDAFARAWFKLTHRDMMTRPPPRAPPEPTLDLFWTVFGSGRQDRSVQEVGRTWIAGR